MSKDKDTKAKKNVKPVKNVKATTSKEDLIMQNLKDNAEKEVIEIEEVESSTTNNPEDVTPLEELLYEESSVEETIEPIESIFVDQKIEEEVDQLNEKMNIVEPQETPPLPNPKGMQEVSVHNNPDIREEVEEEKPENLQLQMKSVAVNNFGGSQPSQDSQLTEKEFNDAINILMSENRLSYMEARAVIEERKKKEQPLIQRRDPSQNQGANKVRIIEMPITNNGVTHVKNN